MAPPMPPQAPLRRHPPHTHESRMSSTGGMGGQITFIRRCKNVGKHQTVSNWHIFVEDESDTLDECLLSAQSCLNNKPRAPCAIAPPRGLMGAPGAPNTGGADVEQGASGGGGEARQGAAAAGGSEGMGRLEVRAARPTPTTRGPHPQDGEAKMTQNDVTGEGGGMNSCCCEVCGDV